MKVQDLKIQIRIGKSFLGLDPYEKLPSDKKSLEDMWDGMVPELKKKGVLK